LRKLGRSIGKKQKVVKKLIRKVRAVMEREMVELRAKGEGVRNWYRFLRGDIKKEQVKVEVNS